MPLTRTEKSELVESYGEGLATAEHVFLLDYRGIDVPQVTELRQRIEASGARYEVVRNRLVALAIGDSGLEPLRDLFQGPTAVAWSNHDPVALAKVLDEFSKEVPAVQCKGGLLAGNQIDAEKLAEIAILPTREELIAKLLFLLQSPMSRLVRTLGALPRGLVIALDQIGKTKESAA